MEGETLGSYRVVGRLGQGGMGAVYLAQHLLIGKRAAIKMLLPELSRDPEIVTRFFNEARSATMIQHPGIVEIFDFGHHTNGCAYIVMEFLDGESLASRLRRQQRAPDELIIEVSRQVASALLAAHERGIIHRDLKPDNVFLVPDPDLPLGFRAKVLDFGIAKLSRDPDTVHKTRTGTMMGTPLYMSPEQCRGAGRVDSRSDIYSLGCLMFEMACGAPPFQGEGVGDIIAAHIFQPPPSLASLRPQSPPALASLVTRMLAKKPEERPQSLADVMAALDVFRAARASGSQPIVRTEPPTTGAPVRANEASTTLGGAASEVSRREAPSGRRSPTVTIITAGSLAAGLVGGYLWLASRRDGATDTPPAKTVVTAAAPVAREPEPEKPAPKATRVKLRIASKPSGATVERDGADVGKTPMVLEVDRAPGDIEVRVRMDHYAERTLVLSSEKDGAATAVLHKLPAPARVERKPAAKKPGKPIQNDAVDPFAE